MEKCLLCVEVSPDFDDPLASYAELEEYLTPILYKRALLSDQLSHLLGSVGSSTFKLKAKDYISRETHKLFASLTGSSSDDELVLSLRGKFGTKRALAHQLIGAVSAQCEIRLFYWGSPENLGDLPEGQFLTALTSTDLFPRLIRVIQEDPTCQVILAAASIYPLYANWSAYNSQSPLDIPSLLAAASCLPDDLVVHVALLAQDMTEDLGRNLLALGEFCESRGGLLLVSPKLSEVEAECWAESLVGFQEFRERRAFYQIKQEDGATYLDLCASADLAGRTLGCARFLEHQFPDLVSPAFCLTPRFGSVDMSLDHRWTMSLRAFRMASRNLRDCTFMDPGLLGIQLDETYSLMVAEPPASALNLPLGTALLAINRVLTADLTFPAALRAMSARPLTLTFGNPLYPASLFSIFCAFGEAEIGRKHTLEALWTPEILKRPPCPIKLKNIQPLEANFHKNVFLLVLESHMDLDLYDQLLNLNQETHGLLIQHKPRLFACLPEVNPQSLWETPEAPEDPRWSQVQQVYQEGATPDMCASNFLAAYLGVFMPDQTYICLRDERSPQCWAPPNFQACLSVLTGYLGACQSGNGFRFLKAFFIQKKLDTYFWESSSSFRGFPLLFFEFQVCVAHYFPEISKRALLDGLSYELIFSPLFTSWGILNPSWVSFIASCPGHSGLLIMGLEILQRFEPIIRTKRLSLEAVMDLILDHLDQSSKPSPFPARKWRQLFDFLDYLESHPPAIDNWGP